MSAYVAHRLTEEFEKHGRGYVAMVAAAVTLTPAAVSAAKDGKRGVGRDLEEGLEKFWRIRRGGLFDLAKAWHRGTPAGADQGEPRAPASARQEAAALALKAGVSPRAIADVQGDPAVSMYDHTALVWLDHYISRQRTLDAVGSAGPRRGRDTASAPSREKVRAGLPPAQAATKAHELGDGTLGTHRSQRGVRSTKKR